MEFDTMLFVALQSSLVLGLIHGVNPCGHSWLVLAPFVTGDANGWRVTKLTTAFIMGTTAGCLAIGIALGWLSTGLPESTRHIADLITASVLVVLGGILIWKPHLLHSHDHDHEHGHGHHHHEHSHDDHHEHAHHDHNDHHAHEHHHGCSCNKPLSARKSTVYGLAVLGFVNMIVPCPTVAIMYSYAIDSGSVLKSTAVFGSYAIGTGIALAGVIYAIFKVTELIRTLQKPWIETMIMRTAGVMTVAFGLYSFYMDGAGAIA
ncbi:sulfite exporter TauE/SafE family protein [Desulfovibrio oxyclinae]|uniref:urease accessory protein UreH domain-containing protein n=1 Tax=Desulfovibrio oxyclinae TaxID=63560 RepID=UPI000590BE3C|nr:sulfite exporter TauE/SafE family protein [Desulfovibrio oxyclinae]